MWNVDLTLLGSATDIASIKLQIWNPDRFTLLSEQAVSGSIAAGQLAATRVNP